MAWMIGEGVYGKADSMDFPENWDELRQETIRRYRYRCFRCDEKSRVLTAHHIMPRERGGADDLTNLIPLCKKCHDIVEMDKLITKAAIIGSYDESLVILEEEKNIIDKKESFDRPSWHKHVYGGVRKVF